MIHFRSILVLHRKQRLCLNKIYVKTLFDSKFAYIIYLDIKCIYLEILNNFVSFIRRAPPLVRWAEGVRDRRDEARAAAVDLIRYQCNTITNSTFHYLHLYLNYYVRFYYASNLARSF